MPPIDPTNWSQLMAQALTGDQGAYRLLLDQIGKFVAGLIRQKIKNEQTVEDIYQTVLLTLHRARHTYDPARPFKPWLYSITRNTIFDWLRRNRWRLKLETFIGEGFDSGAQTDTHREETEILRTALGDLPEKQRQAVEMIKIDGLSVEEAARKAGVSVAAIKVRAHRGYEALKKIIINHGFKENS